MFRDEHMNSYTIFQSAQLLERLRAFTRTGFPAHEPQQRISSETVNPLVTEKLQGTTASQPSPR